MTEDNLDVKVASANNLMHHGTRLDSWVTAKSVYLRGTKASIDEVYGMYSHPGENSLARGTVVGVDTLVTLTYKLGGSSI